jgi:rhomboid-like protein
MNLWGAVASRILCSSPRALPKCQRLDGHIVKFAYFPVRPYSISSTPFRRRRTSILAELAFPETFRQHGRPLFNFPRSIRTFATSRVITRYEDVPSNYKDGEGLPFRTKSLSKEETIAIFGRGMDAGMANRVLRILHGRRVAGTLADPSLRLPASGYDDRIKKLALSWLRKHVPVDEEDAAGKRAEFELEEIEAEILADSERLGLYKPNSGEAVQKGKGRKSIYGESGLDAIREASEQRWLAEEKEKELARNKQAEEVRQNTGTLATRNTVDSRVELKQRGEHPWLKYYLERARVLPEVPPEMSPLQRLWPSGLVALAVIVGSLIFAQVYIPPSNAGRLWPDIPPAAATLIALIAMNSVVFVGWHFPPAFRLLNKYFISVPGYPRALAVLGNTFSHQATSHFFLNMLVFWFMGTRLHDDVGRANFLAIYLSSAVIASFASLTVFAFKKHFVTSSLGASGAIAGVTAAYLSLHARDYFKVFGLPPDPLPGIPGWFLLIPIIVPDFYGLRRVGKVGGKYDHYAHLAGFATGFVGAAAVRKSVRDRQAALERGRSRMLVPSQK